MEIDTSLMYVDADDHNNWFFKKYYFCGASLRYYTFQMSLNILYQCHKDPVIIETGCQREANDIGAGMSTCMFAEFVARYGGKTISVDNNEEHLNRARGFVKKWPDANMEFVHADSEGFLKSYTGECNLLYLDSLDYPIGNDEHNVRMQQDAQNYCLAEFLAIESSLADDTILLIDDNQFPTGGKPKKLKEYLLIRGWIYLFDLQATLWVKKIGKRNV